MDILSHFITLKVIFFGKETHYFILRFYKDNVNVTIENYKLQIRKKFLHQYYSLGLIFQ